MNIEKWTFLDKSIGIFLVLFMLNLITYIVADGTSGDLAQIMQKKAYLNCTEKDMSELECLGDSVTKLPAPFVSLFFPVEYQLETPTFEMVSSKSSEPGTVNRVILARVSQTVPFGKKVEVIARLVSVKINGVCVFFDDKGNTTSTGDDCTTAQHDRIQGGIQSGADKHYQNRLDAMEIARSYLFEIELGTYSN